MASKTPTRAMRLAVRELYNERRSRLLAFSNKTRLAIRDAGYAAVDGYGKTMHPFLTLTDKGRKYIITTSKDLRVIADRVTRDSTRSSTGSHND